MRAWQREKGRRRREQVRWKRVKARYKVCERTNGELESESESARVFVCKP